MPILLSTRLMMALTPVAAMSADAGGATATLPIVAAAAATVPACPKLTAPETGSRMTSEVRLTTKTAWPRIDNIDVNGGRAISALGKIAGSTIGPVNVRGAYSALYMDDNSEIRSLAVSNINVTQSQREGIRVRGNVDGVTICNFSIRMRAEPQSGTHLPGGIPIYSGKNIAITDGAISGFKMVPVAGEYTNGDGISSERPVDYLTIARVTSNDNSDGGFDLKSDHTYLYDTVAERNFRNYRFWTWVTAGTIRSVNPVQAHIWVGSGAEVVIDKLIATSVTPVYVLWLEPDAKSVTIRSCELNVPAGTRFFKKGSTAKLNLGPGCVDK